jgi:hypothetical protein
MLFKNSVRTSKRTPDFTITTINWLTLFKEIIAVLKDARGLDCNPQPIMKPVQDAPWIAF